MQNNNKKKYVWVVEWDNPFAATNKRGMLFYSISPRPGVTKEEFEKFMKEEASPAVDGILTRAIRYKSKYLLEDLAEDGRDPLDISQVAEMVKKLGELTTHKLENGFLVVTAPEEAPPE